VVGSRILLSSRGMMTDSLITTFDVVPFSSVNVVKDLEQRYFGTTLLCGVAFLQESTVVF
jgi:hypothetical protein